MTFQLEQWLCMQVAGFIFGGNSREGKIEMTAPVQSEAKAKPDSKGENIAMTSPVTTEMIGSQ